MIGEQRQPHFCGQCGAELPPGEPRFCIACGHALQPGDHAAVRAPVATTGATVRLANAHAPQAVIGGTIRLPTSGAVPPGMWLAPQPPDSTRVIAIYAPLRAVVGGWSGTISDGWRKVDQVRAGSRVQDLVRFETSRDWFPAPGCGQNLRLRVRIGATSLAEEGHTRRGFRYRAGANPPMDVLDAYWLDGARRRDLALPEIQIMAPPRVQRVSDFDEPLRHLSVREAEQWAREGVVHGIFRLPDLAQQRTPVGRGLPLIEAFGGAALLRITGRLYVPYRVQIHRPLIVRAGAWHDLVRRILADAAAVGLDLGTDAAVEWWLDQQGHDGAIFERGAHAFAQSRTVVAFRRSQIAALDAAA